MAASKLTFDNLVSKTNEILHSIGTYQSRSKQTDLQYVFNGNNEKTAVS